jgi:3-phytase
MASWCRTITAWCLAAALSHSPAVAVAAQKPAAKPVAADATLQPAGATGSVPGDADDCALWVPPADPGRAVVIGTDKSSKKKPGLHVWNLAGEELQFIPVPRPNNVDVRHGMQLAGKSVDIAVCNARGNRSMYVFRIDAQSGRLEDVTAGQGIATPELADPYGLCLYRRPADGAMFVIASSEHGRQHELHEYRLEDDGTGHVQGAYVRTLGPGTIATYAEGLVADDDLGWVYAADEDHAILKFHADPAASGELVATFAQDDGIAGDREGLAIYDCGGGKGWIVLSSQGNSTVKVYRREGEPGAPHRHPLVATLATPGSRQTDGLDITSVPLPGFPAGMLAKHDSKQRRFVFYSWQDAAPLPLGCGGSR